jgi:hypothetical protein
MVEKLSGLLSFNKKAYGDLTQIRLCSGRPQKCTVHNASYTEEVNREYLAKIVENKKVTTTFGKALKFESSVQVSKEFYKSGLFELTKGYIERNAFSYYYT